MFSIYSIRYTVKTDKSFSSLLPQRDAKRRLAILTVILLDGSSEYGAHVFSHIDNLISSRHLFTSTASTNLKYVFLLRFPSHMRKMFSATI